MIILHKLLEEYKTNSHQTDCRHLYKSGIFKTNSKTPTMEPSIFSPSNSIYIIIAVVIAMGFILINAYLTKTAKH